MEDHRSQVQPQLVQRQSLGDVAQNPLQGRLRADVDAFDVDLDRQRPAVAVRRPAFVGLGLALAQAARLGD